MTYQGYAERDLVKNRSSLLIFGATEPERRTWAEAAAAHFPEEGPLRVPTGDAELMAALGTGKGVLYVPDASVLGNAAQTELVRALREREERPKLVLGVSVAPQNLRDSGRLRPDLLYSLQMAQVNLDTIPVSKRAKPPKVTGRSARQTSAPSAATGSTPARTAPRRAAPPRPAQKAGASRRAPAKPAKPSRPARPAARKAAPPAKKTAARKAPRKTAPAARKPQRKAQASRKPATRRR